jgi:hypothetical protein
MNIPFQPGSQKTYLKLEKHYIPYLYRMGHRRYSRRFFKTMTLANDYSMRWAARAGRFLDEYGGDHVN